MRGPQSRHNDHHDAATHMVFSFIWQLYAIQGLGRLLQLLGLLCGTRHLSNQLQPLGGSTKE